MVIHNAILTGSISMQAPPVISGSLTLTGSLNATGDITASSARFSNIVTAQTLVVQIVSSSIDFVTGSTKFGSLTSNTHQFTGSMFVTGALSGTSATFNNAITANGVYSNTSDVALIVNATIPAINLRTAASVGRFTLASNYSNTNRTSFIVASGASNPSIEALLIEHSNGAATFASSVGVGNVTPYSILSLPSGTGWNGGLSWNYTTANSSSKRWWINTDQIVYGDFRICTEINQGGGSINNAATLYERFYIGPTGNVGIGTTTPAQTLEVNGNILASSTGKIGFRYSSTDGNYYSYLRSATAGNVGPIVLAGGFESGGGGNEAIRLVTNANPGERTVLSINNAGTSTFYGDTSLQGNNYINTAKMIQWEGGSYWAFRVISSAATFQLYQGSTGNTPITVDSAGRVSLSTPSTYALTVTNTTNTSGQGVFVTTLGSNNNNASSYHYIAATGGADKFYLFGNGTYQTVSDIRLKKNVTTVTDTYLDKLKDLRVVNYNWKDQEEGHPLEFGLIAQEVEEIIPSIVHEGREHENNIKYKGVQASVLPYILIKAIQELKAEFDEYKLTHP